MDALDLFAGAGGWSLAAQRLGISTLGVEYDTEAVATREAAGLETLWADIATVDTIPAEGLIASPPCTAFTNTGNRRGMEAMELITDAIRTTAVSAKRPHLGLDDASAELIVEPMRFIAEAHHGGQPYRWIAMEQVPAARPAFEAYAEALELLGYSALVTTVSAEQFGVAQTRRRTLLLARRDAGVRPPEATHPAYSTHRPDPEDLVSMGEALEAEGIRPARQFSIASQYGGNALRTQDQPATTVTSKHRGVSVRFPNGHRRQITPAEAGVLQSFPADWPWAGAKWRKFIQIGNAIPPLMAQAVLAQFAERSPQRRTMRHLDTRPVASSV